MILELLSQTLHIKVGCIIQILTKMFLELLSQLKLTNKLKSLKVAKSKDGEGVCDGVGD